MKMFRNLQIHQPESRFMSQLSTILKRGGGSGGGGSAGGGRGESWPEVESG